MEEKPLVLHQVSLCTNWDLAQRYSSWNKLLRITAYLIRFVDNLKSPRSRKETEESPSSSRALLPLEVKGARNYWLRSIQTQLFSAEQQRLQNRLPVTRGSKLYSLNLFMDEDGLIRVGGLLRHSELEEDQKHPIVIASHSLVHLLVRHTHLRALHAGPTLTLHLLREEFWLLRARQVVRSVIHACVTYTRQRAELATELMGDLPSFRVRPSLRAFIHCGVDYAGPLLIRNTPGRGYKSHKAYIALFVCMVTRALHLELVSECITAAFLTTYNRFCARRGIPSFMYSDNAKNFRGAQRELALTWREVARDANVITKLAEDGVTWRFLPPSAPHFGGLWEAGVRSVKHHLRRVVGTHTLTFEEMSTFLCKVEACLNSRPIAPISDQIDDYSALTPGHFLIGSAITALPEPTLLALHENRLTRWQLLSQMRDRFWKAWLSDYLHSLQQRPKWRSLNQLARVGRIVLLHNPLAPPSQWELGRIIECHPGADGLSRVATIKTARSVYKRPISKLCFLPVDIDENSSRPPSNSEATPD